MTLIALLVVLNQADAFSPPPMVDAPQRPAVSDRVFDEDQLRVTARVAAEPQTRRMYELAIPGAVAALGGWVAGWVTLFSSIDCDLFRGNCNNSASVLLLIPQLGPWLAILNGGTNDPWFGHNLGIGLAQAIGLAAMVSGFVISVPTWSEDVAMNLVPTGNGVALGGSF